MEKNPYAPSQDLPNDLGESRVAGIHQLYEQLMAAWNSGDARAFSMVFSADGDLVGFDGHLLQGRRAIEAFHAPLFEKWLKGTRLVGHIESVRFLAEGIAVVHAHGGTIMSGGTPSKDRNSVQTITAVLDRGQWRIAAFQNTRSRSMTARRANTLLWLLGDLAWRLLGDCRLKVTSAGKAAGPSL